MGYVGHSKTFAKWGDEHKRINREMEQIFLEKMQEADPSFTLEQLQLLLDHDTIYTSQEAVNAGLADEVG